MPQSGGVPRQTTATIMVPRQVTSTVQEPQQVTTTIMQPRRVSRIVVEGGEVECLRDCVQVWVGVAEADSVSLLASSPGRRLRRSWSPSRSRRLSWCPGRSPTQSWSLSSRYRRNARVVLSCSRIILPVRIFVDSYAGIGSCLQQIHIFFINACTQHIPFRWIPSLTAPHLAIICSAWSPPRTQVGWTPLHAAINCPAEAAAVATIVELLLASGAAVDARSGVRAQA
jgi:hypothetical protein